MRKLNLLRRENVNYCSGTLVTPYKTGWIISLCLNWLKTRLCHVSAACVCSFGHPTCMNSNAFMELLIVVSVVLLLTVKSAEFWMKFATDLPRLNPCNANRVYHAVSQLRESKTIKLSHVKWQPCTASSRMQSQFQLLAFVLWQPCRVP